MNKHDKKHMKRLEAIARMVERIYDAAADDAAAIGAMAMRLGADGEVPFSFDDYPQAKARMDELLSWLRSQLEVVVAEGVAGEWQLSEDKNDELVRRVLGIMGVGDSAAAQGEGDAGTLPDAVRRRWLDRNEKGREAFLKRKERGLGLSERVWRGTQSFPSEIAMGIDMGILDGKPAASMARDLKQYLKHPDKLFRRVRDERGILHLSKNAAAFHPGQGVYRSSYQNARRLAVTETNMAYRTADHERWQQLDFVVGIEIHLSGNHTCKGRDGKPHKFEDICDQLKGKYPKDFKFTGWHPHCRCHATSIIKTEEELEADTQKMMAGEPVDGESVNKVEEPPKEFSDWMEKNEGRIAEARKSGTLPGFMRENERIVGKIQKTSIRSDADSQKQVPVGSAAMPSGLGSYEQKEWNDNEMEVSEKLEITQGWPMTHKQADDRHANPNYVAGEKNGYDINCQSCVVAYEMRRRGFNVEALRRIEGDPKNGPQRLAINTCSAWIDPKTGKQPSKTNCSGTYFDKTDGKLKVHSIDDVIEKLNAVTKETGRYHLDWAWKNQGDGHTIVAERFENGGLRLFDPQTGEITNWDNFKNRIYIRNGVNILKVDELMPNPSVVATVVRAKN